MVASMRVTKKLQKLLEELEGMQKEVMIKLEEKFLSLYIHHILEHQRRRMGEISRFPHAVEESTAG